jgi:hypothetical protein
VHQKLPDHYFKFWNTQPTHLIWSLCITASFLPADGWFAAQPKELSLDGLKKLEQWSRKCTDLRGDYAE